MSENIEQRRRKCKPLYASLPNNVLSRPLIQHRGQLQELRVSTSEFAIMVCLLGNARLLDAQADHQTALDAGQDKMRIQKQHLAEYDEECAEVRTHNKRVRRHGGERKPFPKKPEHLDDAVKDVGSRNYHGTHQKLRRQPIDSVMIQMTDYQIREQARLDRTKYSQQIDVAKIRLQQPVAQLGPVVLSWHGDNINISGAWLPASNFTNVPLQIPRTTTALALLLFLCGVVGQQRGCIDFRNLCARLGISTREGARHAERSLHMAVDAVNKYLETVELPSQVKLAARYEAKPHKGAVQFVRTQRYEPDTTPEESVIYKLPLTPVRREPAPRKIERVRLTTVEENMRRMAIVSGMTPAQLKAEMGT
jgi:hypothetical protein